MQGTGSGGDELEHRLCLRNWWEVRLEERGGGQILGALNITLRGLNQRKNVSPSDGLRSLFLRMVQGDQISICPPAGFLPGGGGDKDSKKIL